MTRYFEPEEDVELVFDEVRAATEKAVLLHIVTIDGYDVLEEAWVPRSVIRDDIARKLNTRWFETDSSTDAIEVGRWWAKSRGFLEDE